MFKANSGAAKGRSGAAHASAGPKKAGKRAAAKKPVDEVDDDDDDFAAAGLALLMEDSTSAVSGTKPAPASAPAAAAQTPSAWSFLDEPALAHALALARQGHSAEARIWNSLRPGCNAAAIALYRESIAACPAQVESYTRLGLLVLQTAGSVKQIDLAQALLSTAVDNRARYVAIPLPWGSHAVCQSELEHGKQAQQRLGLLACQRDPDAAAERAPASATSSEAAGPGSSSVAATSSALLARFGFTYRLSDEILRYSLPNASPPSPSSPSTTSSSSSSAAAAQAGTGAGAGTGDDAKSSHSELFTLVDGALPPVVHKALQAAFAPTSPFWRAHNYGVAGQGYFSYLYPLTSPPRTLIEQVIQHLFALARSQYPAAASRATIAEWWVHSRYHSYGHQLHYDSDDEGRGGIRHPCVGSILFVDGECGGPTLITNQLLNGPLADEGYLVEARTNRYMMFDGRYLHGVVPGRGVAPGVAVADPLFSAAAAAASASSSPSSSGQLVAATLPAMASASRFDAAEALATSSRSVATKRRMSFMCAFWPAIEERARPADGSAGSAMRWPESDVDARFAILGGSRSESSGAVGQCAGAGAGSACGAAAGGAAAALLGACLPSAVCGGEASDPASPSDTGAAGGDAAAAPAWRHVFAKLDDPAATSPPAPEKAMEGRTVGRPVRVAAVWERCDGKPILPGETLPSYEKCFQGL